MKSLPSVPWEILHKGTTSRQGPWRLHTSAAASALLLLLLLLQQVFDVAWCPGNSTVFAAVTADGRLELWDFAVSTLRPVCQHAVTQTAMTALLFAKVSTMMESVRGV
jgi:WD40 repeat protein